MNIRYQKLTEKELETFIEMRVTQLREEGAEEDIDIKPALLDYYKRHLADGTFVSWLAMDQGVIVGTSGMSFVEKPPYFSCPNGKIGLLSSMFTSKGYRRQGIALQGCGGGQKVRLWRSADHSLRHGSAPVYGFWFC